MKVTAFFPPIVEERILEILGYNSSNYSISFDDERHACVCHIQDGYEDFVEYITIILKFSKDASLESVHVMTDTKDYIILKEFLSQKSFTQVHDSNYYASKWFGNKDLKYLSTDEEVVGVCSFCGSNITVDSCHYFVNTKTGEKIAVVVNASYGTCSVCGAV